MDDPVPDRSGVYTRSQAFHAIAEALAEGFARLARSPNAQKVYPPPVASLSLLERCGYLQKFPQLVAKVAPVIERENQDPLALLPAACLPVYPLVGGQGAIGPEGLLLATRASCCRQEDDYSPVRLRAFTMAEWVFFGGAERVSAFRLQMMKSVVAWVSALGLEGDIVAASDPFYGRGGDLLAESQLERSLKLELTLPIAPFGRVACLSFNLHGTFFTDRFSITSWDQSSVHSACVGVGLERLTLAMIGRHGADMSGWPEFVRSSLAGHAHGINAGL